MRVAVALLVGTEITTVATADLALARRENKFEACE